MKLQRSNRPVILAFNKFFCPGYKAGGPVRTLENLIARLGTEIDFRIVTQDRDLGDTEPYRGVSRLEWIQHRGARVFYMPPEAVTLQRLTGLVREVQPDAVYLNSFFDSLFTGRILAARRLGLLGDVRVVLAPRGEFSKGALGLKALKKGLYLEVARALALYEGVIWQASTEREAEEIRTGFPPARRERIEIARNLAPLASSGSTEQGDRQEGSERDSLRVCFLSRVSPKKNLDFGLRALADVNAQVRFTIYGPKEMESYWEECRSLAVQLPSNISVVFAGPVVPEEVQDHLMRHDVFLFPTLGENYGHVIFEALSAGLYVIISDQTPWQELEEYGVGKVLPLAERQRYAEAIESAARWDEVRWSRIRRDATRYAARIASDEEALTANRRLFVQ